MCIIETIGLSKKYDGHTALSGVNLQIERGGIFALIGHTGSGKTTLLRLINLLDTPTEGKVLIDGINASTSAASRLNLRRRMAFVLQKPIAFNSSVYDNVAMGLKWHGVRNKEAAIKVGAALEQVGLSGYEKRNAKLLSGGETQRVAIARALALEPEILLLDEPTANLDPASLSQIEEVLLGVISRNHTTIVLATHDLAQGQRLAEKVCVLKEGRVLQVGSCSEIFLAPQDEQVAEFVGMENVLSGVITAKEEAVAAISIGTSAIQSVTGFEAGRKVSVRIRPEDVTISLDKLTSSARNSLEGEVRWVSGAGHICRVCVDCGFPLVALITRKSTEEMGIKVGKRLFATFKATSIAVF